MPETPVPTAHPDTAAVILAAGQGTRFKSELAKVLHRAAGRSLLGHVLAAVAPLGVGQVVVVVGHQRDAVADEATTAGIDGLQTVVQAEQLGTGHAVQQAMPVLGEGIRRVMVVNGDAPLLLPETLQGLLEEATGSAGGILTALLDDATGYGRVLRDGQPGANANAGTDTNANAGADATPAGDVVAVVEHKDADEDQLAIREVNAGMYVFDRDALETAIGALDTDNAQGELYLTDVVAALASDGHRIAGHVVDPAEVSGVNDRRELAAAAAVLRARTLDRLMREGVTIIDPATTYVDVDVQIGPDTLLLPGCLLSEGTRIGAGALIGPNCQLIGTLVEDGAEVTHTVAKQASIGPEASVGPFTYLRPGTRLERGAKAGGFVEMKQATVGEGSKVPHLSYVGDATIGAGVNFSAGAITVNYDGYDKHRTVIGDGAFVGCDTMLVAPVTIGKGAFVAAGSVITDDVPADALAIARGRQSVKDGWAGDRRAGRDR